MSEFHDAVKFMYNTVHTKAKKLSIVLLSPSKPMVDRSSNEPMPETLPSPSQSILHADHKERLYLCCHGDRQWDDVI